MDEMLISVDPHKASSTLAVLDPDTRAVIDGARFANEEARPGDGTLGLSNTETLLAARLAMDVRQGGIMDFSAQFDDLEKRVAEAKAAARSAAAESRDQLKERIHQAQDDVEQAAEEKKQQASRAAGDARSKWAQMKADAAARRDDIKAKIDKRNRQLDADAAADEAAWAEADAVDALDYAAWTVASARLNVLDAIDARAYADERAKAAGP